MILAKLKFSEHVLNIGRSNVFGKFFLIGRGAKIAPKIKHYKVGQGRQDGQKWPKFVGRH